MTSNASQAPPTDDFTTLEVARVLGMSVRSIQAMVDRGEFQAWKTPGGHRRIARTSVEQWRSLREPTTTSSPGRRGTGQVDHRDETTTPTRVLLIDDSIHFQKLTSLLIRERFPNVDLQVADDGIAGLALYGQYQPHILIVDILMPGFDGVTLINTLRCHDSFANSRLVVVTSLDDAQRAPYAFALGQVPVIHKPRLVTDLPALLQQWIPAQADASSPIASET